MKNLNIVLAVVAILIGGGLLLTPNGIIVIVENPALRFGIGALMAILGIAALAGARR